MYRLSECSYIDLDIRRRNTADLVAVETVAAECAMQEHVYMEGVWFAAEHKLLIFWQIAQAVSANGLVRVRDPEIWRDEPRILDLDELCSGAGTGTAATIADVGICCRCKRRDRDYQCQDDCEYEYIFRTYLQRHAGGALNSVYNE
jgi:hypothetical protein